MGTISLDPNNYQGTLPWAAYNDPAYADVVKELKGELLRLKKKVDDTDESYPGLVKRNEKYW